jgi:RNA polymerase sigma-32 factor
MTETKSSKADLFQSYMSAANKFPLFSKEEEKKLTEEYFSSKNEELRIKLINHNLRLVAKIALEYRFAYSYLMDLVQEGNIGLIKSVEKFDPFLGVPFASYAGQWIRAFILRFLINNAKLVKIGTTNSQRKMFFNLAKEKARLEAAGIEITDANIAEHFNVSEKEVVEMNQRMDSDKSLSLDEENKCELPFDSDGVIQPDALYEREEYQALLHAKLDEYREKLVKKDAKLKLLVFDLRIMADEPEKFQVIADREDVRVSKQYVQQVDLEIKKELTSYLRKFA